VGAWCRGPCSATIWREALPIHISMNYTLPTTNHGKGAWHRGSCPQQYGGRPCQYIRVFEDMYIYTWIICYSQQTSARALGIGVLVRNNMAGGLANLWAYTYINMNSYITYNTPVQGRLVSESLSATIWREAFPSSHWLISEEKRNVHSDSCAEPSAGDSAKSTSALPSPLCV